LCFCIKLFQLQQFLKHILKIDCSDSIFSSRQDDVTLCDTDFCC
jgi:hypothetical protein